MKKWVLFFIALIPLYISGCSGKEGIVQPIISSLTETPSPSTLQAAARTPELNSGNLIQEVSS